MSNDKVADIKLHMSKCINDSLVVSRTIYVDTVDSNNIAISDVPHIPFAAINIQLTGFSDIFDTDVSMVYDHRTDKIFIDIKLPKSNYLSRIQGNAHDVFNVGSDNLLHIDDSVCRLFLAHSGGKPVLDRKVLSNVNWSDLIRYCEILVMICFQIFEYINTVQLDAPDVVERVYANVSNKKYKAAQKAKHKTKLFRTYKLTGKERNRSRSTTMIYSTSEWGVRGHMRRYKNGNTIWINPQTRRRKGLEDAKTVSKKDYVLE